MAHFCVVYSGFKRLLIFICAVLALFGCGGGGSDPVSDSGGSSSGETTTSALTVDCSGANCGAIDGSTYSGQGIGVWYYKNNSVLEANVPITLTGVKGKTITLIYANQSADSTLMPSVEVSDGRLSEKMIRNDLLTTTQTTPENHVPDIIRNFDVSHYLKAEIADTEDTHVKPQQKLQSAAKQTAQLNDSKIWYVADENSNIHQKQATLRYKATAYDGRVINFWVEDTHYSDNKLSNTLLRQYARYFAENDNSIYKVVTDISGKPWGRHSYNDGDLLDDPNQEIDIVFVGDMGTTLGYFWSVNNFIRDSEHDLLRYSNESLSLYINAEAAYDPASLNIEGGIPEGIQISIMSHEFQHMINFYQRAILMGADYVFETFLDETVAVMAQDLTDQKIGLGLHTVRDHRFPQWVGKTSFNCNLTTWRSGDCTGYALGSSYGAYLLRHYGVDFYKDLLKNKSSSDSLTILDNTIQAHSNADFVESMRRFGTMIALLPAERSPEGFGLPKRTDQGFTLPAIDGPDYENRIRMPQTLPQYLQGYGLFPLTRHPSGNTYTETIPVPGRTTLTIVVK